MSHPEEETENIGLQQIQTSKRLLENTLLDLGAELSSTYANNEKYERDRRVEDEINRQKRFEMIQAEATDSARKNAKLEMRWGELREIEECETLYDAIQEQKEAFAELIGAKESMIEELWQEIRMKDDEYVKKLKEQAKDIERVIDLMREHFYQMRSQYASELESIEQGFMHQRKQMLDKNRAEIIRLFRNYKTREKDCIDDREQTEQKNYHDLEALRVGTASLYYSMKIKYEKEIQNCQKCYEEMKAIYQLNAEKLDYNFKVLTENNDDNLKMQEELTGRVNEYKSMLMSKLDDYNRLNETSRNNNKSLTNKYRMISQDYKDLQKKFKHFVYADVKKYDEIQKMNEKSIAECNQKILKCNNTIHIQILGLRWEEEPVRKDEKEIEAEAARKAAEEKMDERDELNIGIPELRLKVMVDLLLRETEFLLDEKVTRPTPIQF